MPRFRVLWPVSVTLVAVALGGCAADAQHPVGDLRAHTLEDVASWLGADATVIVQDASPRVGEEPSYDATQIDSETWTIVAACSDAADVEASTMVEVAVLPTAAIDAEVSREVEDDEFADAVGCEDGRDYR